MDRAFLEYYEDELAHIRVLAAEFADMHPAVARNLSLDTVPCPDPYVERLLEGVAYLAARTRLKLDGEGARFARAVLDALYPDLVAPTPAVGIAALQPGQQVQTMLAGHVVPRGTRLVAGLRAGLSTRATYTTAQDVTLWPLEIRAVAYHQDRSALAAASVGPVAGVRGEAALRLTLARTGVGLLSELALDRLDLHFRNRAKAPALFDTLFGAVVATGARPAGGKEALARVADPALVGLSDDEALMPRTRAGFEGYRLLREYFMLPERFHFARVDGLQPVVRRAAEGMELVFLLRRPAPELADLKPADLQLFATPVVNLFERDCNVIEIDPRRPRQVIHADRTRPRDFEIYRLTQVEDADLDGPEARIPALFGFAQTQAAAVWSAERRPRRPGEDERRQGRMRTSYAGDDVFLSLSARPGAALDPGLRRLVAARALHQPRPADPRRPAAAHARERRPRAGRHPPRRRPPAAPGAAGGAARPRRRGPRRRPRLAAGGAALAQLPRPRRRRRRARAAPRHARPLRRPRRPGAGPPRPGHRRRRGAPGGRAAADRRADVLRPRHRGHPRRRRRAPRRPQRAAPAGAPRAPLRPLRRGERLRADPDQAPA